MREVRLRLVVQRYDTVREIWLPTWEPFTQDAETLRALICRSKGTDGILHFIVEEEVK